MRFVECRTEKSRIEQNFAESEHFEHHPPVGAPKMFVICIGGHKDGSFVGSATKAVVTTATTEEEEVPPHFSAAAAVSTLDPSSPPVFSLTHTRHYLLPLPTYCCAGGDHLVKELREETLRLRQNGKQLSETHPNSVNAAKVLYLHCDLTTWSRPRKIISQRLDIKKKQNAPCVFVRAYRNTPCHNLQLSLQKTC